MPQLTRWPVALLCLLAFAGSYTRAQPITVSYNFLPNGQQSATVIPSNGNVVTSSGQLVGSAPNHGTGSIALTHEPAGTVTGSANVTATQLVPVSDAVPSAPDQFTNKAYSLALLLNTPTTNASSTLKFTGVINGTLSATTANISNQFTSPTTQKAALGAAVVTAALGPFIAPASPNGNNGSIDAHLTVQPQAQLAQQPTTPTQQPTTPTTPASSSGGSTGGTGGSPQGGTGGSPQAATAAAVHSAPEPSSLVLAGLGLSYLGVACWRRRRRG